MAGFGDYFGLVLSSRRSRVCWSYQPPHLLLSKLLQDLQVFFLLAGMLLVAETLLPCASKYWKQSQRPRQGDPGLWYFSTNQPLSHGLSLGMGVCSLSTFLTNKFLYLWGGGSGIKGRERLTGKFRLEGNHWKSPTPTTCSKQDQP